MGGAAAGEVASRLATEAFLKALKPTGEPTPRSATPDVRLDAAIHAANQAVYQHSRRSSELYGMGTTLVALLLEPAPGRRRPGRRGPGRRRAPPDACPCGAIAAATCFAARARCLLLTHDHSLVEEQVRSGELTPFEAEHTTRCATSSRARRRPRSQPSSRKSAMCEPEAGDTCYLLAFPTGLTRELSDSAIGMAIHRAVQREQVNKRGNDSGHARTCCAQTLIDQANDAGGGDNITVLASARSVTLLKLVKASETRDVTVT